jgi:hypothetical protein
MAPDLTPAAAPPFGEIEELLVDFSEAMGGRYVPMPTWKHFGDRKLTVTHPLGGCRVGVARDNGSSRRSDACSMRAQMIPRPHTPGSSSWMRLSSRVRSSRTRP